MVTASLLTSGTTDIPAVLFKSRCDFYTLCKHLREKEQAITTIIIVITITTIIILTNIILTTSI